MNAQISVIMPVYNKAKYIQKAIDSVLAQKQISVELICVDDGSTDNSVEVIERNRSEDARIRLICQANAGAGAARNVGIEHSSSKFVSFLDPDDWYPNNSALSRLCEGALRSGCRISMGKRLYYVRPFVLRRKDNLFSEGVHDYSELSSAFLYQSCIFDRSLILDNCIRFPSYRRFQDPPFFLQTIIAAGSFFFLDDYVHCYRRGIQKIVWNEKKLLDYASGTFDSLRLARSIGNTSIFLQILNSLNNASFTEGTIEAGTECVLDKLGEIELYAKEFLDSEFDGVRALQIKRNSNSIQRFMAVCSLRAENGVKSVF